MDRKEGRRGNTVVDGWKHSCWSFLKVKTDRTFAENCTGRNVVVKRRRSSRKFMTFHASILKGNFLCRKKAGKYEKFSATGKIYQLYS